MTQWPFLEDKARQSPKTWVHTLWAPCICTTNFLVMCPLVCEMIRDHLDLRLIQSPRSEETIFQYRTVFITLPISWQSKFHPSIYILQLFRDWVVVVAGQEKHPRHPSHSPLPPAPHWGIPRCTQVRSLQLVLGLPSLTVGHAWKPPQGGLQEAFWADVSWYHSFGNYPKLMTTGQSLCTRSNADWEVCLHALRKKVLHCR